jgi:hypothetical protein
MSLQQYLKGFACDLTVEQEVFVVQDEKQSSSTGLEVLQVPPLDPNCAFASIVLELKRIVIYYLSQSTQAQGSDLVKRALNVPHAAREVASKRERPCATQLQLQLQLRKLVSARQPKSRLLRWHPFYLLHR